MSSFLTRYHHKCAACGNHTFQCDPEFHKDGQTFKWVCDECGIQMNIQFFSGGTEIKQTPTGKRCERTKVRLRIKSAPHIQIVADGVHWTEHEDPSLAVWNYEERQCPSNLLRSACEIIESGKDDPHGMFEFICENMVTGPDAYDPDKIEIDMIEDAIKETSKEAH